MSDQTWSDQTCTHEATELIAFATAMEGFFAIYVDSLDPTTPTLKSVIGWATLRCACGWCHPVAYVPQPYSDQLVRASALPGFVSLVGPNPQSDQKAGSTRIVAEFAAHRSAQLAQDARRRRATSHPAGKRKDRRSVPA